MKLILLYESLSLQRAVVKAAKKVNSYIILRRPISAIAALCLFWTLQAKSCINN